LDSQLVLVYLLVLVLAHQLALVLALEPVVVAKILKSSIRNLRLFKRLTGLGQSTGTGRSTG